MTTILYNINELKENINIDTIIYINDNLDVKMITETIKKKSWFSKYIICS